MWNCTQGSRFGSQRPDVTSASSGRTVLGPDARGAAGHGSRFGAFVRRVQVVLWTRSRSAGIFATWWPHQLGSSRCLRVRTFVALHVR